MNQPDAELEISSPQQELIINDGKIRLPISSYGTGVHELVILISSIVLIENSICAIEEPEIHFHPRLQREFIDFLVNETDNQYLISTHSPIIINSLHRNDSIQLFHLRRDNENTNSITLSTESDLLNAFSDLGIKPSDILQSNCVIWVEGSSDANYLKKWLELMDPSLIEGKHYIFISYRNLYKLTADNVEIDHNFINILHVSRNSILIMDSDRANENDKLSSDKERIIKECESNKIKCWVTNGREIENYLSPPVIAKTLKDLNRKELKVEVGLYEKFSEKVDGELKKTNANILDYSHQKRSLSKKFAENFNEDDFSDQLKSIVNDLILEIKRLNT